MDAKFLDLHYIIFSYLLSYYIEDNRGRQRQNEQPWMGAALGCRSWQRRRPVLLNMHIFMNVRSPASRESTPTIHVSVCVNTFVTS